MKSLTKPALTTIALLTVGLLSCREKPVPTPPPRASNPAISNSNTAAASVTNAAATTNEQIYLVKGIVEEVFPDKNKIKINHEAIPGFMEAMTMLFTVKNPRDLAKVKPGEAIRFRMIVTPDDGWIDNIMKMEADEDRPVIEQVIPDSFRRVRDVEPLQVGDAMPDYRFTNQLGAPVALQDFKGQVVVFSFIYTRCPFPTFCPRISGNMAAAHQRLKSMENAPTNWHFLSITIDPEHDTPSLLAAYGRQYNYDPNHWSFVTAPLIDITAIAEQFGLMFWRSDPTKPLNIDHNLRTVILDATGRVKKVIPENEWKVEDLVAAVLEAAKV